MNPIENIKQKNLNYPNIIIKGILPKGSIMYAEQMLPVI